MQAEKSRLLLCFVLQFYGKASREASPWGSGGREGCPGEALPSWAPLKAVRVGLLTGVCEGIVSSLLPMIQAESFMHERSSLVLRECTYQKKYVCRLGGSLPGLERYL